MFVYISDDGDTLDLRYDNWKVVFMEQRCKGTLEVWAEPFTPLRVCTKFNETFVDFPKIQKPNTFTAEQAVDKMQEAVAGS